MITQAAIALSVAQAKVRCDGQGGNEAAKQQRALNQVKHLVKDKSGKVSDAMLAAIQPSLGEVAVKFQKACLYNANKKAARRRKSTETQRKINKIVKAAKSNPEVMEQLVGIVEGLAVPGNENNDDANNGGASDSDGVDDEMASESESDASGESDSD